MFGFLSGQLWKFATAGAALIALGLSLALLNASIENRSLTKQITVAEKRINDPKTGLVVRLAQAETNVVTVRVALTRQNEQLKQHSAQAEARLALLSAQLSDTQRRNRRNLDKINKLMALPPQGPQPIDRYEDIDRRLVESLK